MGAPFTSEMGRCEQAKKVVEEGVKSRCQTR